MRRSSLLLLPPLLLPPLFLLPRILLLTLLLLILMLCLRRASTTSCLLCTSRWAERLATFSWHTGHSLSLILWPAAAAGVVEESTHGGCWAG